jgi:hypothetical protein
MVDKHLSVSVTFFYILLFKRVEDGTNFKAESGGLMAVKSQGRAVDTGTQHILCIQTGWLD